MSATFVMYIDESGDEGFSFNRGSSEWFVLSAVIVKKVLDLELVRLVDLVRQLFKITSNKPLHFVKMSHNQRVACVKEIARTNLKAVSVMIYKPLLREPEKFQERYRLYFYAVRYLLERASWFCRDHKTPHDRGDGTVEINFSNRAGMSYKEMKKYLRYLKVRSRVSDVRIEWSIILPERIKAYSHKDRKGLQVVDAVASGFFSALQPSRYGYTEDRYARIMKPIVYYRQGQYIGYGLKFWPPETMQMLETEDNLKWTKEVY